MNKKTAEGFTLIEIMVALAIAAIMGVVIMSLLSTIYQNRQQNRILTSRVIDTAIMKQALNATVTTAGAIVTSPTPSATSAGAAPSSGNFFSKIWNAVFGCTILSAEEISDYSKMLGSFFGYRTWDHLSKSGGNSNLQPVTLPDHQIHVTSSTVSFYWISNNDGGQELCQGTLQISGNVMRYIVSSQNLSGGSSTCTANGQSTEEADFPIGNGWSFQPTLQTNTSCLGPAFPSQPADALVAIKAPMAGTSATSSTASTQVSVCLPNNPNPAT